MKILAGWGGRIAVATAVVLGAGTNRVEASRLLTSGIVFPTTADAVFLNPAGLAEKSGGTFGRLAYDDLANGYAGMLATSSDTTGYGAALNAEGAGALTLAAAYDVGSFQIGADMSLTDAIDPSDAKIGLGLLVGDAAGLRFGVTMSSVLKSDQNVVTFGIGYAEGKDYAVELDVEAPTASLSASGQPYTQTIKAVKFFRSFGVGAFETSAAGVGPLGVASPEFGGVLQFKIAGQTSFDFKYETAGGGTFGFGFLAPL